MEDWIGTLSDRSLNQVIIPGSHDSGTYALNACSKISPDSPTFWAYLAPWLAADVAKCQQFSIIEQLKRGIRFFDFRIAHLNGEQWFVHGQYSVRVSEALQDLPQWLDQHPKEIVMILASFLDYVDPKPLIKMIGLDRIAQFPELTPESKLSEFWEKKKNAILIVIDDHAENLWPYSKVIVNDWPNVQDINSLKVYQDKNLPVGRDDKLYVTQLVITPTASTVVRCGVPSTFARQVDTKLISWLSQWQGENRSLNIILTDFVGRTKDLISQVVALNI